MRILGRAGAAALAAAALVAVGFADMSQASAGGAGAHPGSTAAARNASVARPAASTGYFNTYSSVAKLGNANDCYSAQGFAVGSNYTYAAKINGDENKAVLYRTRMSDGATTLMKNGDNQKSYATYLGHANDIVLTSNNGSYYMYIVTMKVGSTSLVKLKYVGTTYYKVGSYTIKYNGANHSMTGVKITSKTSSSLHFLFKSGKHFYRGWLGRDATSGSITLSSSFTLNVADAKVNGKTISDIGSYLTQGFGYLGSTVYFPMTYKNVSIVLVYRNIPSAAGTITAASDLSFRITSHAYPNLFEIESVGFGAGNHLWFSTNRRTAAGDTAHDGVHYFNDYTTS